MSNFAKMNVESILFVKILWYRKWTFEKCVVWRWTCFKFRVWTWTNMNPMHIQFKSIWNSNQNILWNEINGENVITADHLYEIIEPLHNTPTYSLDSHRKITFYASDCNYTSNFDSWNVLVVEKLLLNDSKKWKCTTFGRVPPALLLAPSRAVATSFWIEKLFSWRKLKNINIKAAKTWHLGVKMASK